MEPDWKKDIARNYLLLGCHAYQAVMEIISKEQKDQLNGTDVDARFDLTTGRGFIKPQHGKKIHDPVFGPELWELWENLMRKGGESVGLPSKGFMTARVYRLRRLFRDTSGYFFITQRHPYYAIRLNPERTLQIITEYEHNPT